MGAEIYELEIRPRTAPVAGSETGSGFDASFAMLESRLGRIPGVGLEGNGRFHFGERDEHGIMEIDASAGKFVRVQIPRPWVMQRGAQVFALVFMTAEWCQGEVFDPQIGQTLEKDVVLQGLVAVRQAQREVEASGTEKPAPQEAAPVEEPGRTPWWKRRP